MAQLLTEDVLREAKMSSLSVKLVGILPRMSSRKMRAFVASIMTKAPFSGDLINVVIEKVATKTEKAKEPLLRMVKSLSAPNACEVARVETLERSANEVATTCEGVSTPKECPFLVRVDPLPRSPKDATAHSSRSKLVKVVDLSNPLVLPTEPMTILY
ncbi:hypothetical protein Nepgr_001953 [Nepenthes gracilis]|uniref:Uncharacterized protein n=1 Tax=Nepenthes gracilis TaxID=150966 RepID=A0AAD3P914_NEPGR|nr:hypothetical protein Nepgr_001953 [Nepenthes gracilis]